MTYMRSVIYLNICVVLWERTKWIKKLQEIARNDLKNVSQTPPIAIYYPAHYYTATGLAWDAALKVTVVNLELLSDPDMLLMVEKKVSE